ncbi:hypothetical protein ACUH7Y_00865 [Clostridium beijerinckii]|uniref:Uncharacterized protein n=1 Tax=Clostridium beijerinckii TaxID=1520 RepID=A0A7X9XQV3_CLOBE|nr:hypothetical protein [Clostridium beijerinckii]NMF06874.1 hypothetical protein [Clostridium beijerinckii]
MFYKDAIKVWREGNKEELINKFLPKFIYTSLKLEGINITYSDVEDVFAGDKADKEIEDYMDFCEGALKQDRAIEIKEDSALIRVSNFYCNFHNILDGKVSRALFNYILISNDLPPIIIFSNDKEEHDLSLEYFHKTKDISKMLNFLEKQAFKTWIKDYNVKIRSLKDYFY